MTNAIFPPLNIFLALLMDGFGYACKLSGDYQRLQASIPDFKSFIVAREGITKFVNESHVGLTYTGSYTKTDMTSWREILECCPTGFQASFDMPVAARWVATSWNNPEINSSTLQEIFTDDLSAAMEDGATLLDNVVWQYPEATDQYRRLITVVTELQESKELFDLSSKHFYFW